MPSKAAQRDFLLPPSDSFSIQIICIIVLFPNTFYSYLSYKDDFFFSFLLRKDWTEKALTIGRKKRGTNKPPGQWKVWI